MCDGGDGGGAGEVGAGTMGEAGSPSGSGSPGSGGSGTPGGPGGMGNLPGPSSGGNVGPGLTGVATNSGLGVSTAGELGIADADMGIGGEGSPGGVGAGSDPIAPSLLSGWEEATTTSKGEDPALSSDQGGFNPNNALTGFLMGSAISPAMGLVGLIAAGLMGAAQPAPGDPGPSGGGPADGFSMPQSYPKPPGWGDGGYGADGDYFYGSSVSPPSNVGEPGGAPDSPWGISNTVSDVDVYPYRSKLKDDNDSLLKTLVFDEKEFTKSLF